MTTGGVLSIEGGIPSSVRRDLSRMGHRLQDAVGVFGGYQAVARDPRTGAWEGASESRKDGCAMGY
jgi:gamma-glutamyltranspeptidase/glutathione hydrolase